MIYLHKNGITVVAKEEAKRGKVYELNGEEYYVARGVADIKRIVESGEYPLNRVVTSKLTSLNYLFQIQGGYSQAAVPEGFNDDITNWDTSNVLSMEEVFSGWPAFNQDISNWDTSKVESMHGMFKSSKYKGSYYMGPTSFNQPIGNWDVSNVKNMSEMFLGATSFNQDLNGWDVSNVENMDYMFSGATSFNQSIGNWDTSNVQSMKGMFSDVVAIGIVAFVGTFEYTFAGSTSFNQPIGNWNVSNVKNMSEMFRGATSFNQDINSWDVSNVEDMSWMFSSSLKVDEEPPPTSFNQPIGNWDVSKVQDMGAMFAGSSFNQDISNWDVSNVTSMSGMFRDASSFNQSIGNWDVSKVESMGYMFRNAKSFNQDLNGWGKLVDFDGMFYGASSFNSPIGKCKLSSTSTSMENMFREATSFNQDISSWDVSNVTQMKGLFQDATSFNQDLRTWKLNEKLPKSRTMFQGATAFNIKEYSPFLNLKTEKTKRVNVATQAANSLGIELTADDKKTISKIKKLLTARDLEQIDLGVELLRSLQKTEVYETLLFGCKIIGNENLERPKMFTGSGPAQPFLDYALINLIADAPNDAKVDISIDKKNITSLDINIFDFGSFDYNTRIENFVSLKKFFNLESLVIDFDKFNIKTNKDNGVDLEEVFLNNTITNLIITKVNGSLNWLKSFSKLKKLDIRLYNCFNDDDLKNFNFLKNLEHLKFSSQGFKNLDFLSECKKIKSLNLTVLSSSYSQSNEDLENINFLASLNELEHLVLEGAFIGHENLDMSGLFACKNLKDLAIPVKDSANLSDLKNCSSLESLDLSSDGNWNTSFDILARISQLQANKRIDNEFSTEKNGLKELKNLKHLTLDKFNFFGIANGNLMTDSKQAETNLENRVNEEDTQLVDSVIRYKAVPFTGTILNHHFGSYSNRGSWRDSRQDESKGVFNECQVVEGYREGLYKEYYTTGDLKLEALYKKNKLSKVTAFYNSKGENILGNKSAILGFELESPDAHRIGGDSGGFLKNDKPYNGFCYLELERSYKPDLLGKSLFENFNTIINNKSFRSQYSDSEMDLLRYPNKNSLVLTIKEGLISNTLFIAGKEQFAKITVSDDYNFETIPSEYKEVFTADNLEFEKRHRLSIYLNSLYSLNYSGDLLPEGSDKDFATLLTIIDGKSISQSYKKQDRPKLSSDDRKVFSEIKKQLTSRDYDQIDQAISKLVSLNITELFETLLESCKISEEGLTRNKFFEGSSPAQPSLDYGLFSLIAHAPEDADIHESIKKENINELNINIFSLSPAYSAGKFGEGLFDRFIPVDELTSLNHLDIDFKIFEETNKGPKNTNRSDWFKNSNITKLDISVSGSLKFFKNLTKLKYLNLSFGYYADSITDLKSLEYLENLEELKITTGNFKKLESLDFIKNNKKLKKLTINLKNSWGDDSTMDNLDVLKNFNQLEELKIIDVSTTNLNALSSCKNLKKLDISYNKYGRTTAPFEFSLLKNCNSLETLSIEGVMSYRVEAKITDFNSLSGLKNLKKLSIDKIILHHPKSIFIN